jgi:tRNA C32,U32 (ribose-2'-O)-methylase TrmJ
MNKEEKEYLELVEHYLLLNPKYSALEIINKIERQHPKLDSKLKGLYEKEEMTDSEITGVLMGIIYKAKFHIKKENKMVD